MRVAQCWQETVEAACPPAIDFNQTGTIDIYDVIVVADQWGWPLAAGRLLNETLDGMTNRALIQANEPLRVYLTCYCAARSCGDARAHHILASAHRRMAEQAATLPDEASRHQFWQNVPVNRDLRCLFEESKIAPLAVQLA